MVHQVVFRSSIRRLRHVANKQKDLYRSFASTTNNTTTNNRNNQNGANSSAKGSIRTTTISSTTVDTATSKAGSSSSFQQTAGFEPLPYPRLLLIAILPVIPMPRALAIAVIAAMPVAAMMDHRDPSFAVCMSILCHRSY